MTSREDIASRRNPWLVASVAITTAIAVVAAVVGFVWLPSQQQGVGYRGVWDAICSAAGFIRYPSAGTPIVHADYPTTRVEIVPGMLTGASAEAIGRGATLALRCSMCHGAGGLSQADIPNLAGQGAAAVYKQLVDFRTGARTSAVMAPLVAALSDREMRDLAAYYAYLPRISGPLRRADIAPRVVESGAPMRGIAPCGACHGELASKPGAPWLTGQPLVYLRTQLGAFSTGARHNDIGEQMRNVARAMTPAEIDAVSRFYAARP